MAQGTCIEHGGSLGRLVSGCPCQLVFISSDSLNEGAVHVLLYDVYCVIFFDAVNIDITFFEVRTCASC